MEENIKNILIIGVDSILKYVLQQILKIILLFVLYNKIFYIHLPCY
jgi:hypothetical protein